MLPAACSPPALADTRASANAVAEALLDAIADRDRDALARLSLSEQEFRDHVWDYLPAARPERNLPRSYIWGDLHQKSQGSLARTLSRFGGRRYELLGVEFDGGTDFGAYRVHRRATLRVRDSTDEHRIRISGSMIEKDGAWKVFSYAIDD